MITENYRNAFTEVYMVLEHLKKEDYDKISNDFIKVIDANKNNDYNFILDPNLELKNQNLLPETRGILFNLFYDYYADEKQKKLIQDIWRAKDRKEDLEKQNKYNINVFKDKTSNRNGENLNSNYNQIDISIKTDQINNVSQISDKLSFESNDLPNTDISDTNNEIIVKKDNIFIKIFNVIKNAFKKK